MTNPDSRQASLGAKKLPPFGKNISPVNNTIRILYGWPHECSEINQALVLPVGEDPSQYCLPVKNLHVFCPANAYTGPLIPADIVRSLTDWLVRDGAKSIVVFVTKIKPDGRIGGEHFWPRDLIKWEEVNHAA